MDEIVETMKPWAIKAMSSRVIDEITETARTSTPKVTVGELLERVWNHWKQDGGSAIVSATAPQDSRSDDLDKIERAVAAAVKLADSDAVPETFRKRANRRLLAALPSPMKGSAAKPVVQVQMRLEGPSQKA